MDKVMKEKMLELYRQNREEAILEKLRRVQLEAFDLGLDFLNVRDYGSLEEMKEGVEYFGYSLEIIEDSNNITFHPDSNFMTYNFNDLKIVVKKKIIEV